MEKIILIGGGGHCKSIIDSIQSSEAYIIEGIIDVKDNLGKFILGVPVIGEDSDIYEFYKKGIKNAFISLGSIGNVKVREKLYKNAKNIGFKFPIIKDKTAIVANSAKIAEGVFIGKGAIINSDSYIGENAIINTGAIIEHDCKVEKFVHISPGVTLSGSVFVGENTHIGINSTIIQGINIEENSLIGAGTVVVKNIEKNKKVFGNPGREK